MNVILKKFRDTIWRLEAKVRRIGAGKKGRGRGGRRAGRGGEGYDMEGVGKGSGNATFARKKNFTVYPIFSNVLYGNSIRPYHFLFF